MKYVKYYKCSKAFAAPFGVSLLEPGAELEEVCPPGDATLMSFAAELGGEKLKEELRGCFPLRIRIQGSAMQAESKQILIRLAAGDSTNDTADESPDTAITIVNFSPEVIFLGPPILPNFPRAAHRLVLALRSSIMKP